MKDKERKSFNKSLGLAREANFSKQQQEHYSYVKSLVSIVTELAQTNSYELPYRGEELIAKARTLLGMDRTESNG